MTRNKTLATWLAFVGGPFGLHRFYLHGLRDAIGWSTWAPTLLGVYGIARIREFGQDDMLSWALIPLLGLAIAASALQAIVLGLMSPPAWNARFNPGTDEEAPAGRTGWMTVFALVLSLLLGTAVLMASLAFGFQHYFEYQISEAKRISA